jgi:hypothetical protein
MEEEKSSDELLKKREVKDYWWGLTCSSGDGAIPFTVAVKLLPPVDRPNETHSSTAEEAF